MTTTTPAILGILTIYSSKRDVNGNCYHSAEFADTASGAVVRFGDISGPNNMSGLAQMLHGASPAEVFHTQTITLPARAYNRLTRDWPYVCNHADDKAVAAIRAAIAEAK